ncbi:MAG: uroporphyrinogen decarboxylase family protein [Candidatus Dormibacteraceae bacterium]
MDSRDRVVEALGGKVGDRSVAGAWGHIFEREWSARTLAQATVERARNYGWDFVKLQPRSTCYAEAFGGRWKPSGSATIAPILVESAVPNEGSWERVKLVNSAALEEQAQALGLVNRELGDRVPVIQTVFSPISVANYMIGHNRSEVVRQLRNHPERVLTGLEAVAEALITFARQSLNSGAAGIFYAVSGFATPDLISSEDYRRWLLPLDRYILESLSADAWFNVLHLCGGETYLDLAAQLPVQVISYSIHDSGNPALGEARQLTGKAVMGGIDQRKLLIEGPVGAISQQVRAAIDETDGGQGLLLAPSCSVPPEVPEAHWRAMMPGEPSAVATRTGPERPR